MYKLDELSLFFGRLEWDAYLISRGVRALGDHHFKIDDYAKIRSQIKKVVEEQEIKMLIKHHETSSKIKVVEIILYHPKKGTAALERLRELDEKRTNSENSPLAKSIVKKVLNSENLTEEEKIFQKKLSEEWNLLEVEYGKLYGYDESSIKEHMNKLAAERHQ